jgi:hypothetical protein
LITSLISFFKISLVDLIWDQYRVRRSVIVAAVDAFACWDLTPSQLNHSYTFLELIRGFISNDLVSSFTPFQLSKSTIFTIIASALTKAQRYLYTDIWLPRCESMIEFERSHGISQRQKKHSPALVSSGPASSARTQPFSPTRCYEWMTNAAKTGLTWQDFRIYINMLFPFRMGSYLTLTAASC